MASNSEGWADYTHKHNDQTGNSYGSCCTVFSEATWPNVLSSPSVLFSSQDLCWVSVNFFWYLCHPSEASPPKQKKSTQKCHLGGGGESVLTLTQLGRTIARSCGGSLLPRQSILPYTALLALVRTSLDARQVTLKYYVCAVGTSTLFDWVTTPKAQWISLWVSNYYLTSI